MSSGHDNENCDPRHRICLRACWRGPRLCPRSKQGGQRAGLYVPAGRRAALAYSSRRARDRLCPRRHFHLRAGREAPKEMAAGEADYLAPNVIHRGMNKTDKPVRLFVVRIKPKDKPLVEEVPPPQ